MNKRKIRKIKMQKGTIITNKATVRDKKNKELDKEYDNLILMLTK